MNQVETLAGPGFCSNRTEIADDNPLVGSVAVDKAANAFVEEIRKDGMRVIRRSDGFDTLRTNLEGAGFESGGSPGRLAPDGKGGVFVARGQNIAQIDAKGTSISTVAGDPAATSAKIGTRSSGDGGIAKDASFVGPVSIASDPNGNLYVADFTVPGSSAFRIRFINLGEAPVSLYSGTEAELLIAPGSIQTVAGSSSREGAGGGKPAVRAVLSGVEPSMSASGSRLYLAVKGRPRSDRATRTAIKVINTGGSPVSAHGVTVSPGGIEPVTAGPRRDPGSGAPRSRAEEIGSIAADDKGNLYFTLPDAHRVRRIDAAGTLTTIAGAVPTKTGGFNGNNRGARGARLNRPADVAVGPAGDVWISDQGNRQVRIIGTDGKIRLGPGHTTVSRCRARKADTSVTPHPAYPFGVAVDQRGEVLFTSPTTKRVFRRDKGGLIRREPFAGAVAGPIAVSEQGVYVLDPARAAVLFKNRTSTGVKVHRVRVPAGKVRTVAGGGSQTDSDSPLATRTRLGGLGGGGVSLNNLGGVALDGKGNLFIADPVASRVWIIHRNGRIATLAGEGAPSPFDTCCNKAAGLAVDFRGNLYVADMTAPWIWLVNRGASPLVAHGQTIPPGSLAAVAGTGSRGTGGDGPALSIPLNAPSGLALDGKGNLYLSDVEDHSVRKLDQRGLLTTVAGTGSGGFTGDGLAGFETALNRPTALAIDRCGNLVIADSSNDRIRRLRLAAGCAR